MHRLDSARAGGTPDGRCEAALHRWDLAGGDAVSRELLSQPDLTVHALSVLNSMEIDESIGHRAELAGPAAARLTFGSPGQPDVVVVHDADGTRLQLDEPDPAPTANSDPATRLLALWGRRSAVGEIRWGDNARDCRHLAAFLWGDVGSDGGSSLRPGSC